MLTSAPLTPRNRILGALPADEYAKLLPNLKSVKLPLGSILYKVGEPISHIYFPETAIISTVTYFEDGASIETGITGSEGVTGVSVALSNDSTMRETTVQAAGDGWQISRENFLSSFNDGGTFHRLILRYVYAFFEQIAQSGACINHHNVYQRLARWLLMCHDRVGSDELYITQDFIAQMLGVNRPSVTVAAIEMKEAELLNYSRGVVKILDRRGLESITCECYATIKRVYDQYLSWLELQQLNGRMEKANQEMASEMNHRQKLKSITDERVEKLRNVINNLNNDSIRIPVCAGCQRICNSQNNPQAATEYFGKKLNAEFVSTICNDCRR